EVGDRHCPVQRHAAVAPPAPTVRGHLASVRLRSAQRFQLPIHRRTPAPVLELHGTQPVSNPLVESAEHLRRLRELEVGLPARHVSPELFGDLRQATPTRATRHLSDALLEGLFGLVRHLAFDLTASAIPEGITEKLPARCGRDGRLGLIDLQMESVVELAQPVQHAFARTTAAYI